MRRLIVKLVLPFEIRRKLLDCLEECHEREKREKPEPTWYKTHYYDFNQARRWLA